MGHALRSLPFYTEDCAAKILEIQGPGHLLKDLSLLATTARGHVLNDANSILFGESRMCRKATQPSQLIQPYFAQYSGLFRRPNQSDFAQNRLNPWC